MAIEKTIPGNNISFTLKTIISVGVNVVVGVFFLSQMNSSINSLKEAVIDLKQMAKQVSEDNKVYQKQNEAEKAMMNIRINALETKMDIYHPESKDKK